MNPPACLDTYRELFAKLDKQGHWLSLLDEEGLLRARTCYAEGGKAWKIFFYGGDTGDMIDAFRALSERARNSESEMGINACVENDNDEEMASDEGGGASAVVRRELMLALVDRITGDESDIYEDTAFNIGISSKVVYHLVAGNGNNGDKKRPRSPASLSISMCDTDVLPDFQRSAVPLARTEIASAVPESFSSLLGSGNPVLRSVRSKRRILALRAAALSRSIPDTKVPYGNGNGRGSATPNTEYFISCNNNGNDTNGSESCLSEERIVALGRAAAALVLEHVGYTHASTRALDVLVDASCSLVRSAGKRLASARERLDNEGHVSSENPVNGNVDATSNRATLANVALTGVRGGAAALQSYATYEARKAAAELVNSEARLTNACVQRGIDPAKVHLRANGNMNSNSNSEGGMGDETDPCSKFNAATWTFGLLPQGARIDLLESAGAHPPPPRALVCHVLGVTDPAGCGGEDNMDISTGATDTKK